MRYARSRLALRVRTLAIVGWSVLAAWWAGCRPQGLARSLDGQQPAAVELAPGDDLTQTMVVNAAGFEAITVYPVRDRSAASGTVAFDVLDAASGSSVLRVPHRGLWTS
jgi:hypothetical protein